MNYIAVSCTKTIHNGAIFSVAGLCNSRDCISSTFLRRSKVFASSLPFDAAAFPYETGLRYLSFPGVLCAITCAVLRCIVSHGRDVSLFHYTWESLMKLALRAFAMTVVLAGLVATPSSGSSLMLATNLTASADPGPFSLPIPICGPGVPCPPDGGGNNGGGN